MILSKSEDLHEYTLVKDPIHFPRVQAAMLANFDHYFDRWLDGIGLQGIATKLGGQFSVKTPDPAVIRSRSLRAAIDEAIEKYEKAAVKYRRFFDPEALDEYRGAENDFKNALKSEVPIIQGSWNSPSVEMNDWKLKFKQHEPKGLYAVFENLVDFATEWRREPTRLDAARVPGDVGFDKIDDDPTLRALGVVGVGITSCILYHLEPSLFPVRDKPSVFALYFLAGREPDWFGMPTRSSEFLMVVDRKFGGWNTSEKNFRTEHNFWYPYGLYALHSVRLWELLRERAAGLSVTLAPTHRFVALNTFLHGVKGLHSADVATMLGHDERLSYP